MRRFRQNVIRYGGSLLSLGAVTFLVWRLRPYFETIVLISYFAVVMLNAWRGGRGPGIVTAVGSVVIILLLFPPPSREAVTRLAENQFIRLGVFLAIALVIVAVTSARQRIRRALEESEQYYRGLFENAHDAITVLSPKAEIVLDVNRRACEIYGFTHAEFVGMSMESISKDIERGRRYIQETLANKGACHFESTQYRKDGTELFLDINASRVSYRGRQAILSINRDITARKRAETALKLSEQRFRSAVDSFPYAFVIYDSERRFQFVNARGILASGKPANALLGHRDEDVLPPEVTAGYLPTLERALATKTQQSVECAVTLPEGLFTIIANYVPLLDDGGEIYQVLGITYDITDRKRSEQVLRESETRFRQLADAMPQIVWAARPDGYVDYYNQRWYDFTGFAEGEDGNALWSRLLHPDDVKATLARYDQAIRSGEPYEVECRFKDPKTGDYGWRLGRAAPITDESGNIIRWFGSYTDIDDQKRAQDTLKAANRAKDDFLATVSHELRTPLNAIMGWSQLLALGKLDEAARTRAIEVIERNARSQSKLIEDLLDASRITRNTLALEAHPVDLKSIVETAVEAIRPAAEAGRIEIHVAVGTAAPMISGDPDRLQQIVGNLLSNAVKFTPAGGRVDVRLEQTSGAAEIAIRDTGIGIAPDFLPYVFDRFRQADTSHTRRHGGLGLGLAIARHLVESHGGSITAESEGPGRGALFTVTLPLARERTLEPALPQPREGGQRPMESAIQIEGLWVVAVDDEPETRSLLIAALEDHGAQVSAVGSSQEALDLIANRSDGRWPDVLISDIAMPGEDGYALISKVREQNSEIPAIALTAYAAPEDRARALAAGFQLHISKPVALHELAAAIATLTNANSVIGN